LKKKSGFFRWRLRIQEFDQTGHFLMSDQLESKADVRSVALLHTVNALRSGQTAMFGGAETKIGTPPSWNINPIDNTNGRSFAEHWTAIPDFDPGLGDIKTVWELSRFSWVLLFARAALASGNVKYLQDCNNWIESWCNENPINQGPNWMSGQEVAVRLIHILLSDLLLRRDAAPGVDLEHLVFAHCGRIQQTIDYGIAQNNNHAISEAAGLFIGGSWLEKNARSARHRAQGKRWRTLGKRVLETGLSNLVLNDGTFAQYSITYHRLLLDTLVVVEWCRLRWEIPQFSDEFYDRARLATNWLFEFVDAVSGDCANIGPNDGALVYALSECGHRDFRPTVQLAGVMFCSCCFYVQDGPWNEPIAWLGLQLPRSVHSEQSSLACPHGGFGVLRAPDRQSYVVCRFPVFAFRPSHSDALHVDLWCNGVNILRDGGSFSYAAKSSTIDYYMGVRSHNTCQFDERDQMPRIGRFLFADWLRVDGLRFEFEDDSVKWRAAYTDTEGCRHERALTSRPNGWVVTDRVSGPFETATLRWRLCPEYDWKLVGQRVESTNATLRINCTSGLQDVSLVKGWESRIYLEKSEIPVLEVLLAEGEKTVVTEIELGHYSP
jgi:hypothetical protein